MRNPADPRIKRFAPGMCLVTGVIVAVVLCGSVPLPAADWVSADGVVTVEVPESGRFAEEPAEPPIAKVWGRNDGAVRVAVVHVATPRGMPEPGPEFLGNLSQGFLSELSKLPGTASLIHSSTEPHNGATIYEMTATVRDDSHVLYNTQWVLYANSSVYKVMAVGIDVDTQLDADVQRFLASLRTRVPPVQRSTARQSSMGPFLVAFWGGMLIVVVMIVAVARFAGGVPVARSSAVVVLLLSAVSLVTAIRIAPAAENGSVLIGQFLPTLLMAILGLWLWNRSNRRAGRIATPARDEPIDDSQTWILDQDEEQT